MTIWSPFYLLHYPQANCKIISLYFSWETVLWAASAAEKLLLIQWREGLGTRELVIIQDKNDGKYCKSNARKRPPSLLTTKTGGVLKLLSLNLICHSRGFCSLSWFNPLTFTGRQAEGEGLTPLSCLTLLSADFLLSDTIILWPLPAFFKMFKVVLREINPPAVSLKNLI